MDTSENILTKKRVKYENVQNPIGFNDSGHNALACDSAYLKAVVTNETARAQTYLEREAEAVKFGNAKLAELSRDALISSHKILKRIAKGLPHAGAEPTSDTVIRANAALTMLYANAERLAQAERGINPGGGTQINIQIVAPAPVAQEIVDAEFRLKE